MSQQRCSNFQKLYLELLNLCGDDPYIFEKHRKSFSTFVNNIFPGSDFTWLKIGNARSVQILKQNKIIQVYMSYLRFYISK